MLWLALVFRPTSAPCDPLPWFELACRLGHFTPRVVQRDEALLAELAASVRLFGGLPSLLAQIRDALSDLDLSLALAATPRAALWLARGLDVELHPRQGNLAQTRLALRTVPVAALKLEPALARRMASFGFEQIGELMDLPRSTLAVRLGHGLALELARALGEIEDPQRWYVFPEQFSRQIELPAPVDSAPALLFAARRLLAALVGWLDVRNASVTRLIWRIDHGHGQATEMPLDFSLPVHAVIRIERVLAERLAVLVLPAPALALELQVDELQGRDPRSRVLFDGPVRTPGDALSELVDRLHARLGASALQELSCHADFRPEYASKHGGSGGRPRGVGQTGRSEPLAGRDRSLDPRFSDLPRPLWLLDPPEVLSERNGALYYRKKRVRLLAGPERIESGWWDGGDIQRDYFIATDVDYGWLWVFREARGGTAWYLQGWFS